MLVNNRAPSFGRARRVPRFHGGTSPLRDPAVNLTSPIAQLCYPWQRSARDELRPPYRSNGVGFGGVRVTLQRRHWRTLDVLTQVCGSIEGEIRRAPRWSCRARSQVRGPVRSRGPRRQVLQMDPGILGGGRRCVATGLGTSVTHFAPTGVARTMGSARHATRASKSSFAYTAACAAGFASSRWLPAPRWSR
jgi:hypothetical protein